MTRFKILVDGRMIGIVNSYQDACDIVKKLNNDTRYYWKDVDVIAVDDNLVEGEPEVDLEEEIKKHTDLFQADIEYPLRLTAIKFYELGIREQTKNQ